MPLPHCPRIAVLAFAALLPSVGFAAPGADNAHPHYLEALTDLRLARALLEVPDRERAEKFEKTAIDDIDQAMAEIRHAAIDDGKDLKDHPPIDANVSHRDRLHEILQLVDAAGKDLAIDEDDKKALGWRARATTDTANARAFVMAAISNDNPDTR
jgi:hypothetical protein